MKIVYPITAFVLSFIVLSVYAGGNMKAFPPPEEGMVRYVIQLPKLDDESTSKVEVIAGKTVLVDEKNQYFFGGQIQKEKENGANISSYFNKKIQVLFSAHGLPIKYIKNGDPYIFRNLRFIRNFASAGFPGIAGPARELAMV